VIVHFIKIFISELLQTRNPENGISRSARIRQGAHELNLLQLSI